MPSDDPTELFDVCDANGDPLGRTKPRALVHRDGDWHRTLHVWVVLEGEGAVLLQRRSLAKESHPGKIDVSVAGHVRAGETVTDALREAEEEIGLIVRPAELVRLGVRRSVDVRPGQVDREVQEVFSVTTPRPFESLRPDPDEVSALLALPLAEARRLASGEVASATAREVREGALRTVEVGRSELVPARDGYFALALESLARIAAGERVAPWTLGAAEGRTR